jgi:putative transposase
LELNVQKDHVHLVVMIPPKVAVSELMGRLKGQTSIKLFSKFRELKKKPYWGNHFWSKGYCVDTVGLDAEMIRKYVKYQEERERQMEQLGLDF